MNTSFSSAVTIQHGAWKAQIIPEHGSNVIALTYKGSPILRSPETPEMLFKSPTLYGMPLLLPANRVKGAAFSFMGTSYPLPMNEPARNNHIHGLINNAPFSVVRVTENSIVTALDNHGAFYPFPFNLQIEDSLSDRGFSRKLTLRNTGKTPMPYTLAYHTAFVEPKRFAVPIAQRAVVDENYIPTGELAALSEVQQAYRDGFSPNGSKISGFYTSQGSTAVVGDYLFTVSQQFDHWILFNGAGDGGFLCIEPQCGAVNGLNTNEHRVLDPGQKEVFTIEITKKMGET